MHLISYMSQIVPDFRWEEVTALVALTGFIGTILIWSVTSIIDRKLAAFLVSLNGTYLRKELAMAKFDAIYERFDLIREHGSGAHPLMSRDGK